MNDLRKYAQEVIRIEAAAVHDLAERLDANFEKAVQAILECKGRVIVAGMGKSGLIGKKIAATFNSTGISSFFLHPAEALHGDLGLMRADDILLVISKSGRLGETATLLAAARRLGVSLIYLGGTMKSELAERADIVLDCAVEREACPNNLVPTSSSTAALVMGDALAVALLKARKFGPDDFADLHPGGSIGRRLLVRVSELHHTGSALPLVAPEATMQEMILEMTSKRLGCVLMLNEQGGPGGVFTDGDLRRVAEKSDNFFKLKAADVMLTNPKTIAEDALLDRALALIEKHSITQLATVDASGRLVGVIHLHDILKSKLV
ncbi:MAG: KpsF/GutQ family sugar-phosphate isomerase [candidate division Zixibacteria bacterium]|nr:KpsF/GutQ family sugar-phosphate isomerase [candidate division Zixibacteria bacterium]MDH3937665.1 KpsF/GutQ family sugar-phosphate isomerase [candidate division Zixibacteria bacterium]MDH4035720.1 KpsF/GutQ family sugar-phosphate isomerase [candidate division Zixibacteria bacterium]